MYLGYAPCDDEVTIGYTGIARHVISPGMLLQVLLWHIISLGRSCKFCKRNIISPRMYLLNVLLTEMMETYMEDRPTCRMKKGWLYRTSYDK